MRPGSGFLGTAYQQIPGDPTPHKLVGSITEALYSALLCVFMAHVSYSSELEFSFETEKKKYKS
jgi:hypothetical protein